MHEPRGGAAAFVPPSGGHKAPVGTENEVTSPDKAPALVVESGKKRAGDDDPTTLHIRDSDKPVKADATARGVAPAKVQSAPKKAGKGDEADVPTDTVAAQQPVVGKNIAKRPKGSNTTLYVLIALFVVVATFFALYYGGVIKL